MENQKCRYHHLEQAIRFLKIYVGENTKVFQGRIYREV